MGNNDKIHLNMYISRKISLSLHISSTTCRNELRFRTFAVSVPIWAKSDADRSAAHR